MKYESIFAPGNTVLLSDIGLQQYPERQGIYKVMSAKFYGESTPLYECINVDNRDMQYLFHENQLMHNPKENYSDRFYTKNVLTISSRHTNWPIIPFGEFAQWCLIMGYRVIAKDNADCDIKHNEQKGRLNDPLCAVNSLYNQLEHAFYAWCIEHKQLFVEFTIDSMTDNYLLHGYKESHWDHFISQVETLQEFLAFGKNKHLYRSRTTMQGEDNIRLSSINGIGCVWNVPTEELFYKATPALQPNKLLHVLFLAAQLDPVNIREQHPS